MPAISAIHCDFTLIYPIHACHIALREANCLLERGGYVRLLDVGGKIRYEEIRDRKSGKLVPSLKFSREDQVALDYPYA